MRFLAFFWAKITIKSDIQNPKLIGTHDYQPFNHILSGFCLFLQISDAKLEFLLIKLKVHKNGIFRLKT